jgi:VIT1/CCC1 family predicted Fe2+/Mn2+ transporter
MEEVATIFREYGMSEDHIQPVVEAMRHRPKQWVDFMMRFELGLEKPDPKRARVSATVIASAYVAGGLIPLWPYMLLESMTAALVVSSVMTLAALAIFGFIKGRYTGARPLKSAFQTTMIGGLAATAAFLIARAIGG